MPYGCAVRGACHTGAPPTELNGHWWGRGESNSLIGRYKRLAFTGWLRPQTDKWCAPEDSNLASQRYQRCAFNLRSQTRMVVPVRVERTTSGFSGRRSRQLS